MYEPQSLSNRLRTAGLPDPFIRRPDTFKKPDVRSSHQISGGFMAVTRILRIRAFCPVVRSHMQFLAPDPAQSRLSSYERSMGWLDEG